MRVRLILIVLYFVVFADGNMFGQTTSILKNIRSGSSDSYPGNWTVCGGQLFFTADDGQMGRELWKTDGTENGTVLVKDINSNGPSSSNPFPLAVLNDELYLLADDGGKGFAVWKTDGTEAGTVLIKYINKPRMYADSSYSEHTIVFNSEFYFLVEAEGRRDVLELWKTDGTQRGTERLKDQYIPGLYRLTEHNGKLYFVASDGRAGKELWVTGGSVADTKMLKDIRPGKSSANPAFPMPCGRNLYFAANDGNSNRLWMTDGTKRGTVMVPRSPRKIRGEYLTNCNGRLFFTASVPHRGADMGLWVTDGTADGTTCITVLRINRKLTSCNGQIFFVFGNHSETGEELWKSDGTATGTGMVRDIKNGREGSRPGHLTVVHDQLYFSAEDWNTGRELWKTDGTAGGTVLVKDIEPRREKGSNPNNLIVLNNQLVFGAGGKLWTTDGNEAGTVPIADFNIAYSDSAIYFNGSLYFSHDTNSTGAEPWKLTLTTTEPVQPAAQIKQDIDKPTFEEDLAALQGAWKVTLAQRHGKRLTTQLGNFYVFDGQMMAVKTVGHNSAKMEYKIDPTTTPKQLDRIYRIGADTQVSPMIYLLDGGTLAICYSLPGMRRPTGLITKAGDQRTLIRLTRVGAGKREVNQENDGVSKADSGYHRWCERVVFLNIGGQLLNR